MANRFWVGGTANWDATAGTKWATTDGGAGGASAPTAADDVFFTAASGVVTVTVTAAVNCLSLNFSGFTGTLAGAFAIGVVNNVTIASGMTWTHNGALQINGVCSFTSNGKTIASGIATNNAATNLTLADALTTTNSITVNFGTFTTNNFNVTALELTSNNSNTRTINLGSSTVTLNSSGPVNFSTNTGLTFNAGTSTIICTAGSSVITGASASNTGVVFYNASFTNSSTGSHTISGINTFNNITVTGPASAGVVQVLFAARQTINGTLSTTSTAGNRRVWFRGQVYGIAQTLTINSAPSLTDADFRDLYVIGTAAPISGTRIGNLRGCRGITFSTPKTVFWNLAGAQNWSANAWATTSTGAPSTDNFPLAQDTATFTNAGSVTGTISLDFAITYMGSIDMSGRTSAMTLAVSHGYSVYGNWTNGSGVTFSGIGIPAFSGRNTQTITSAGRTFSCPITVDSYGGLVELADALNIGSQTFTVTNGTFDTKNFNVTAGSLSSDSSNVRTITLGSSTVTLSSSLPLTFTTTINLTFNAGTSQITSAIGGDTTINFGGLQYNNLTITTAATPQITINGANTFNNLTLSAPSGAGIQNYTFPANQTITGTLTVAGATAVRRIFLRSNTLGTPRTLTVNSLSAQDCDFRDITIAGAAAGSSPTRAGNCGGNTGITFPAAKTVYWNLAGTQNWSDTGWATSSGGTPAVNNFPLAQDTAVFDNTGSVGTVTTNGPWNIGTLNMSGRTSACTIDWSNSAPNYHGNVLLGSGVTPGTTGNATMVGRGTQTITSSGRTWSGAMVINSATGTVQLADALVIDSARALAVSTGTFDAVSYNVTAGSFTGGGSSTLKMGSGTWTLSGTGTVWSISGIANFAFYKGTSNIVLSNISTSSRAFSGGTLSYNKLTIGGATGSSTTTISDNNQFTELASTKTVAHTIALGANQTLGAWTVTGTAGNVVTVTGTAALTIAGAAVSGVDYLALGTTTVSATSPGEFYAGANSTATSPAAPLYLTAKPADSTRFWVGGTGNWSDTARWSTSSGGGGGASVPRSHDDVVFNSASNATAYTATVNAVTGGIRTKALTIAGPASGNLTLAGSTAIDGIHGNVTLPATGLTRTYSGAITLSGSATGRTLTTNGVALGSGITVNGVGCAWTLGSALDMGASGFVATNGSFATSTYSFITGSITTNSANLTTLDFGSSTVTVGNAAGINFGTTENNRANLTLTSGTYQLNLSSPSPTLSGNNQTFYNVSFTGLTVAGTVVLNGANTFNNFTVVGQTSAGVANVSVSANQIINGTLTLSAGTNATMRTFVRSDTIGTTRTLTCAAFSGTDADFRDITIAGAAAPVSGTRLGDCKGNSGITFPAAKTVFWRGGTGDWGANNWSATNGGAIDATQFPLPQDTATIPSGFPASGATITINAAYNIGTIDMSARTSNTMTLATSTNSPTIYGNWINGTGTTLTGTGVITFAGRVSQTITSAGRTFTQQFGVDTPGGSVTLQDAFSNSFTSNTAIQVFQGSFNANNYNVTLSAGGLFSSNTNTRTIAIGSGLWTIGGSGSNIWGNSTATGLTITGTGTLSFTSASSKSFNGGNSSFSGITINQGGAGALTIVGNNTLANISNTYKSIGATNITLGATTQRVANFTASGEAGRVLTVQGTSASSPATLVFTGLGQVTTPDYLTITGVRAYNLTDTWYAGANSTNNGSLGWIFSAGAIASTGNFFLMF